MKGNSKPWFNNQILSAIQRRDKLYKMFKNCGLEKDKDYFKVAKMHLHSFDVGYQLTCPKSLGKGPKQLQNLKKHSFS